MKTAMVTLFACCMIACANQPAEPQGDPAGGASVILPINVKGERDLSARELGNGETSASLTQDCVFIEWCNRPNSSEGTVCRVRSSCLNQCATNDLALLNECVADANFVCGGITQIFVMKNC